MKIVNRMTIAIALVLALTATGLWAAGATEEAPAAAMEKEMVRDPATGKMVTAPEYGGTFNIPRSEDGQHTDLLYTRWVGGSVSGVLEKPVFVNWAIDRAEFNFIGYKPPLFALKGTLAERWETPDDTTIILHIRKGVHWHDKAPVNGRQLTAQDIEYNFHRLLGNKLTGTEFSEAEPGAYIQTLGDVPFESITATDDWTVVFELKEPNLNALLTVLNEDQNYIYAPEVIKEHGDATDWRNLVGTGPFMLTDWVEGSSMTHTKNPDYWGYDEKYPQNRLPYVDEIRSPLIPEQASLLAALRSGKVDWLGGSVVIRSVDQAESLERTNPEIELWVNASVSHYSTGLNVNKPPFDDIRVRKAMQMALDLEGINNGFYKGYGDITPHGKMGDSGVGYFIPFEEWPAELKKVFDYDPEGAEKLLDEAGYPRGADGTRFKSAYTLLARYDPSATELMASYWRDIGVDVEIQVTVIAPFSAIRKDRTFEMITSEEAWGSSSNPLLPPSLFLSTGPYNQAAVADPDFDALYEAAAAATTIEEQQRLVKELDMYAIERKWVVWAPMSPLFEAMQPWVQGYNGEFRMSIDSGQAWARFWIDSELKESMGH